MECEWGDGYHLVKETKLLVLWPILIEQESEQRHPAVPLPKHCSLGNVTNCPDGLVFKVLPPFKKYASTWHQSSFHSFWINDWVSYFREHRFKELVHTQGGCWKSKGIVLPGWKKRSARSLLKVEILVGSTLPELNSATCLFSVLDGLATLMSARSVDCHWAGVLPTFFFFWFVCLNLFGHAGPWLWHMESLLRRVGSSSLNRDRT